MTDLGEKAGVVDRIAAWLGIWALRRLFGECATDVKDEFPGEPVSCLGCDAARLIHEMKAIAKAQGGAA